MLKPQGFFFLFSANIHKKSYPAAIENVPFIFQFALTDCVYDCVFMCVCVCWCFCTLFYVVYAYFADQIKNYVIKKRTEQRFTIEKEHGNVFLEGRFY